MTFSVENPVESSIKIDQFDNEKFKSIVNQLLSQNLGGGGGGGEGWLVSGKRVIRKGVVVVCGVNTRAIGESELVNNT